MLYQLSYAPKCYCITIAINYEIDFYAVIELLLQVKDIDDAKSTNNVENRSDINASKGPLVVSTTVVDNVSLETYDNISSETDITDLTSAGRE